MAVINWEQKNNLQSYLCSKYESVLIKLEQRKILSIIEYTGPGNPRLYAISDKNYRDLKKTIRDNLDAVQNLKSQFSMQDDSIILDTDLPF